MTGRERQTELIGRLRNALAGEPVTREVSMFGGRAFMVDGQLLVSAARDGGLLVRVAADRHSALLAEPGATQAEMGAGRSMGPGWIEVGADAIAGEDRLSFWISVALARRRAAAPTSP